MKKYFSIILCSIAMLAALQGCKPSPSGQEETPSLEPVLSDDPVPSEEPALSEDPSTAPEEPSQDWSWENGYPKGVSVEVFDEDFSDGGKCHGYIATIDFSINPNLKFNCLNSSKKKKPTGFFADLQESNGTPCLAINGGYFAGSTSVSLVARDGKLVISAFRAFNWPNDEHAECTMYPVRSAIGRMGDGHFEIQWTYCTDPAFRTHTVFPSPLDNNEKTKTFMTEPPKADYCEGTWSWEPQDAIGGGPRLVKDGKDVSAESYWGECLDAGGTSGFYRVNRTAAGITEDNKLILIVADGRGSNDSKGYTLAELAAKFISLGCTDAMNLDGGGSSCIVGAEGKILNAPSDSGGERSVASAIVISELPH